jgi:hypothetical protein
MSHIMLTRFVLNSTLDVREETNLGDDIYMAQDTWTVEGMSSETQVLTAMRERKVSVAPHCRFQDWTEPSVHYFTYSEWLQFVIDHAQENIRALDNDEYDHRERCPLHRTPMFEDHIEGSTKRHLVCLIPKCDITRPLRSQQA